MVTISGVEMSAAAAENVTETAADVTSDLARPLNWRTSPVSGATHRVSDGDVGYWVVAPGLTTAQVREAFVASYEGDPSGAEVYSL